MSRFHYRYPLNVPGKYYVNDQCTDCDLCRECAPNHVRRDDRTGVSYVFRQPETPEERMQLEEGVVGCPTGGVGNDGDQFDWNTTPIYDWNTAYAGPDGIRFEIRAPLLGEVQAARNSGGQHMNMEIREERPGDVDDIRAVTREAFRGQVHTCGREAEIVDQLRDAGALSVSLVAHCDEQVVGHVAVSPLETDAREAGWYGIGPVSVHPTYQRRGIGTLLMKAALAMLSARGARGCVLVGHPEYYVRFGFRADGSARVDGVPAEVTFCLKFRPPCPDPGTVTFHSAFGVH